MQEPTRSRSFDPSGWLAPSDAFLRSLLELPELALVDASCDREVRLHESLAEQPRRTVCAEALAAVADADARANYTTYLAVRDALCAAGTLEAYYLALLRAGPIAVPPVFVERIVAAIVEHLLDAEAGPFERRAGQLLYRQQRIAVHDGRVLSADRDALDRLGQGPTFDVMRLADGEAGAVAAAGLSVLGDDNAHLFDTAVDPFAFVLDLTHEVAHEVSHGLVFTMTRARSGQAALARVLERWIAHLLGVCTTIRPLPRIDDDAWSWHVGLDVDSTALLNDLYRGHAPEPERMRRLIGLFRLDFADAAEMRPDLAGRPVYLGLAMNERGTLRLKAQNLLVNLPLAAKN
jgi:Family of unknown function (DUF6352)